MSNKTNYLSVFGVFLVLGMVVLSYFYLLPKYVDTQKQLVSMKQQVDDNATRINALTKAKTDLDSLDGVVDQMFVAMPADNDKANLLTELEAIFASRGSFLPTVQIADGATSGTVDIAFSITGSLADTQAIMQSLEGDIRFMNIQSVAISSADGKLTTGFQIQSYKRQSGGNI